MTAIIVLTLLSLSGRDAHAVSKPAAAQEKSSPQLVSEGLYGYISMSLSDQPEGYGYGVSLYATAWPLTAKPLSGFQIGLASIWIVPDNRKINYSLLPHGTLARDNWPERGPSYRDVFQTIEGGLGFWGNTRFGSPTAKFRMNGTPNGYNYEVSSPGWGFGGGPNTNALPDNEMGIAQLSNRILVPPDGFTFKKGTNGQLLGYAWMALPLVPPTDTTGGLKVSTGNRCWTLFLNTGNARGPVAFWTPTTWSQISLHYKPAEGRGLDARPGLVTGGAIEVNTVPRFTATGKDGTVYSKIPQLQFPADSSGKTVLIEDLTHYSNKALWDETQSWIDGSAAPSGRFNPAGAETPACHANPLSLTQGPKKEPIDGFPSIVETTQWDKSTFGFQWQRSQLQPWENGIRKGVFPQYFKESNGHFEAIPESEVPDSTGLKQAEFPGAGTGAVYSSPVDGVSSWSKPGPAAGPFYAHLSDGSTVTYYWYKFIDQPAMQNTGLSNEAKVKLQALVEKIQRSWTFEKQYMAPPSSGKLASLDPGMIVKPPKGLEYGYVPIATSQRVEK